MGYLNREQGYVSKEYIHHGTSDGDIVDYIPGDELTDEHFTHQDLLMLLETDSIAQRSTRRTPIVQTPTGEKFATPKDDENKNPEGGE